MELNKEPGHMAGFFHLHPSTIAARDWKYTSLLRIDDVAMSIMNIWSKIDRAGISTLRTRGCGHCEFSCNTPVHLSGLFLVGRTDKLKFAILGCVSVGVTSILRKRW